jgi:methionyl-tRNA formyltransferase
MIKMGFVTCVQLGLSCMEAIYAAGGELVLAVTLEDRQAVNKSGRIYLDDFCQYHNVPLVKSSHVNNADVIEAIQSHQLDWLFIIGWSQIASISVLQAPKKGVLGMHPTLLPMGRGRAAIPWAILKRLPKTGVTLFKLDSGVDTGPIADQIEIPLSNRITATELYQKVDHAHTKLIHKVVPNILNDSLKLTVQDESQASEWPGRTPEDGAIDLKGSVYDAECLVRAVTRPYPGAFILQENGNRLTIWEARIVQEQTKNTCLTFPDGILECLEFELSE